MIVSLWLPSCAALNTSAPVSKPVEKEIVFLLHGLGRSRLAMWVLASRLEDAGFMVNNIGYASIGKSPEEILKDVTTQINSHLPEKDQAVHFVGHSLGGLIIRAYLEKTKISNLGRVVLIGTPNKGTPLVDKHRDACWMQLLGSTTLALGTTENSFPNSISDPYYPVGIIAGIREGVDNEDTIPGKDDGLVPLESTKMSGMTDFIVIDSSHWMLRYDRDVAMQTIGFLKHGRFKKNDMDSMAHTPEIN